MWIEAILSNTEVTTLVDELLPLTIALGHGEIHLHDPIETSLVADAGIRVVCKARVKWPIVGVDVPVVMHSLAVMLEPRIAERPDGRAFVLGLHLDHADVAGIPTIVDDEITRAVNRELEEKRVELAWTFGKTLGRAVPLPAMLAEVDALELAAPDAKVKVTNEALGLALRIEARVRRRGEPAPARAVVAPPTNGERATPHAEPSHVRATVAAAVAGALVGAAGGALVRRATRSRGVFR